MEPMKKMLSKLIPRDAKKLVKYLLRTPKRIQVMWLRITKRAVKKEEIAKKLSALGIKKGDTIMVHSSLSAFGYVEGGAKTVIGALQQLVEQVGNVCMPCFGPLDSNVFDSRTAPSGLGKISDLFWRLPEARRSLSPTHNVACIGKNAAYLCSNHHLDETPFGRNSPYFKMIELDAWVVALGSGLGNVTIYHVLEDMAGEKFPLRVYSKKKKNFTVIDRQGKKTRIAVFVHDLGLSPHRIDNNPKVLERITRDLEKTGFLKKTRIGNAKVFAIKTKHLIAFLQKSLKENKTIYASEKEINRKVQRLD